MSKIKFEVDLNDEEKELGPSPYVSMHPDGCLRDLKSLRNPDDIVIRSSTVTIIITYPCERPYSQTLELTNGFLTRAQLAQFASDSYVNMYSEEEATSSLPIESCAERNLGCCLLNRAPTDGKYGIVFHGIGDLVMCGAHFDPKTNILRLEVDS